MYFNYPRETEGKYTSKKLQPHIPWAGEKHTKKWSEKIKGQLGRTALEETVDGGETRKMD